MVKRPQRPTSAAPGKALRATVQRRCTSTRREMFRQLSPLPNVVSDRLLAKRERLLRELGKGCVYCGADDNTMDHIEPLVSNGMPTGLIATTLDMLPCCSNCNSSKGAHTWRSYMKRLKWPSRKHHARVQWLAHYDRWRRRHAQRWNVHLYVPQINMLNHMVNECHAFMQKMVNDTVQTIHGTRAIVVHAKNAQYNWDAIRCQMMASI